jgi:hypothetical protein
MERNPPTPEELNMYRINYHERDPPTPEELNMYRKNHNEWNHPNSGGVEYVLQDIFLILKIKRLSSIHRQALKYPH